MSQLLAPYEYEPLEANEEIRILILQPAASFDDPLIVQMVLHKIQDSEVTSLLSYDAVSYCWGTSDALHQLQCNGKDLKITPNVNSILRHLRKPSQFRNLWIDALCINQNDIKEKEKQVRIMGTIFSLADKVHVWLGNAAEEDQIPPTLAFLKEKVLAQQQLLPSQHEDQENTSETRTTLLVSFLSRPWFRRRWVLQEVALSHDVTIRCGHYKLSWNWVRDGIELLHSECLRGSTSLPLEAIHALENAANLRPGTKDILQLLFECHSSQCADERDRLFSLYSMVSNESKKLIDPHVCCPVDYSGDWSLTYTVFAAAVVEVGLMYELLSHAITFGTLFQQNPGWPSWVPSWNLERKSRRRLTVANLQDPDKYGPQIVSVVGRIGLQLRGVMYEATLFQDTHLATASQSSISRSFMEQYRSLQDTIVELTRPECLPAYGIPERFAWLLVSVVNDARLFYHCAQIDFDSIFGNADAVIAKVFSARIDAGKSVGPLDLLHTTLFKELGGQASTAWANWNHLKYSAPKLHDEVDRVMQGHNLFFFRRENNLTAGISCSDIQSGDYIFQPRGMRCAPSGFAFLLRPSGSLSEADVGLYTLTGTCFVDISWVVEPPNTYPEGPLTLFDKVILV